VEMPASWPQEALKAQACAARAYAEAARRRASGAYDLYCDTRSQVYGGVAREDPRTDVAVAQTAGVVPSVGGAPIQAFYFSSSGGQTENVELAWSTSPISYLKGVEDPYDADSPAHTWGPLARTGSELEGQLRDAVNGSLRAVAIVERGVSPRVVEAAIIGTEGVSYVHGSKLRSLLGLPSAWVNIRSMSIGPAASERVTVERGTPVILEGRTYPALADGRAVELRFNVDGTWRSQSVATVRGQEALAGGHVVAYSSYRMTVSPSSDGEYYFALGENSSPRTVIEVAR